MPQFSFNQFGDLMRQIKSYGAAERYNQLDLLLSDRAGEMNSAQIKWATQERDRAFRLAHRDGDMM